MATPVEFTTRGFRVEPCHRCPWPEGSRWAARLAASEREAERAEERHEHYCRQGARDDGGKHPAALGEGERLGTCRECGRPTRPPRRSSRRPADVCARCWRARRRSVRP